MSKLTEDQYQIITFTYSFQFGSCILRLYVHLVHLRQLNFMKEVTYLTNPLKDQIALSLTHLIYLVFHLIRLARISYPIA